MIDFIGDVHGHSDRLETLLKRLGYCKESGVYRHPTNKAIFLGDYIDRGPDVRGAVNIVRHMVEAGSAQALLGNHEFNALCFWQKKKEGGYLRDHSINKILIHVKTLEAYQHAQEEFQDVLSWFLTLPLFIEAPEFRAEHACFDEGAVKILKEKKCLTIGSFERVHEICSSSGDLSDAVNTLLQGPETELSEKDAFIDSEGIRRTRTRIKWWADPKGKTLRELAFQPGVEIPPNALSPEILSRHFYGEKERPVLFGHYWLKGKPELIRSNVCCLDYSVASYKGNGVLAAYRFAGEKELLDKNLIYV
ncbi:MAG: metallophosphoesterase [Fibrobacteraceae bacterium]|nr:metallophosphoesterase [Fibrobacteraceae bacterium]